MKNYLQQLIDAAGSTMIEISANYQGLSVTVRHHHGSMSEPVEKSASFWIDKSDGDMAGRMDHFLELVRKP